MHIEKRKCKLSVTALHTIAIVKKNSKILERDRNAYQISQNNTQKETDWGAPFFFLFCFYKQLDRIKNISITLCSQPAKSQWSCLGPLELLEGLPIYASIQLRVSYSLHNFPSSQKS